MSKSPWNDKGESAAHEGRGTGEKHHGVGQAEEAR